MQRTAQSPACLDSFMWMCKWHQKATMSLWPYKGTLIQYTRQTVGVDDIQCCWLQNFAQLSHSNSFAPLAEPSWAPGHFASAAFRSPFSCYLHLPRRLHRWTRFTGSKLLLLLNIKAGQNSLLSFNQVENAAEQISRCTATTATHFPFHLLTLWPPSDFLRARCFLIRIRAFTPKLFGQTILNLLDSSC